MITGKRYNNSNNISGKTYHEKQIPEDIKNLKKTLINRIILPINSKQWKKINENMFSFEKINKQIDKYHKYYKNDDLLMYKEITKAIESVALEHQQLEELEKKIYGNTNDISTIIYKTTQIRLKPEYEVYDSIFGKPNKNENETYNLSIIKDISDCLAVDNIDFDEIKRIILEKHPLNSE